MSPSMTPHRTAGERRERRRLGRAPSWAAIAFTASLVVAVPFSLFAVEHFSVAVVAVAVVGAMACATAVTRRLRTRVGAVRALAECVVDIHSGD